MHKKFEYTNYSMVKEKLVSLSDIKYRKFQSKLIPGEKKILGVRIPELRAIAKQIAKSNWRRFLKDEEEKCGQNASMEETLLCGLVIGYAKMEPAECLDLITSFVPKIKNWAVCDSFCANLKFTAENRELVFNFLQRYIGSSNEFSVRFAVIMLTDYFIDDKYINKVLKILDSVRHCGYYAKMAVAWAVSVCFVKYPGRTYLYLQSNNLDDDTYNKSLQKILESYRVSNADKENIRGMKRKKHI